MRLFIFACYTHNIVGIIKRDTYMYAYISDLYLPCVVVAINGNIIRSIRFRVHVSDIACRTIGFVPLMYPL